MRARSARPRLLVGWIATAIVVVVCLVTAPPIPLALALGAGATVLLAQGAVGFGDRGRDEPTSRHPVEALIEEVERSRRYGRQCTLARVSGAAAATAETRRTDEAWDLGGDLMLLMPETTGAAAHLAVERLVGEWPAEQMAIATFPDDALTVHGLLEAIRAHVPAEPDATPGEEPSAQGALDLGVEVG